MSGKVRVYAQPDHVDIIPCDTLLHLNFNLVIMPTGHVYMHAKNFSPRIGK